MKMKQQLNEAKIEYMTIGHMHKKKQKTENMY